MHYQCAMRSQSLPMYILKDTSGYYVENPMAGESTEPGKAAGTLQEQ